MLSEPPLPLTEATFFILLSLAPGPQHGYAIMKEVDGLSKGRVVFSTGTLYGALKRLLDQGWIERVDSQEAAGSRPHKDYQLTDAGRRLLLAELARLEAVTQIARLRLKPEES